MHQILLSWDTFFVSAVLDHVSCFTPFSNALNGAIYHDGQW